MPMMVESSLVVRCTVTLCDPNRKFPFVFSVRDTITDKFVKVDLLITDVLKLKKATEVRPFEKILIPFQLITIQ